MPTEPESAKPEEERARGGGGGEKSASLKPPKCAVCASHKKGVCGTATAPLKCARRRENEKEKASSSDLRMDGAREAGTRAWDVAADGPPPAPAAEELKTLERFFGAAGSAALAPEDEIVGELLQAHCALRARRGSRARSPARRCAARATPAPPPSARRARRRRSGWRRRPATRSVGAAVGGARSTCGDAACPPRTTTATRWRMRSGTRSASSWTRSWRRAPWRTRCARCAAAARARRPTRLSSASGASSPCTRTATASRRCRRATGCAGRATSRRRTRTTKASPPRARRAGSEKPATARSTTRGPPASSARCAAARSGRWRRAPATHRRRHGRRGRPRTSRSGRL